MPEIEILKRNSSNIERLSGSELPKISAELLDQQIKISKKLHERWSLLCKFKTLNKKLD